LFTQIDNTVDFFAVKSSDNSNFDTETADFLSNWSEKDAKWDFHRSNVQTIGEIYGTTAKYSKLANRMNSCSTCLGFGMTNPDANGEIKPKLVEAKFCHVRHCPGCQWRRSLRNHRRLFTHLPTLEAEIPGMRWIFLTLTVKNPVMSDLRSTIAAMNAGWKRLIQRKDWPALGWLRAVEVTKGQDGNPHPHFHVMLCVKPSYFKGRGYIKQSAWLQNWRDAMRDQSIFKVHIQVVKPKSGGALFAAVVETLKYSFKPGDIMRDPAFLFGMTEQLHKLRFLSTGGVLKGLLKDKMSNAEMINGDESEGDIDQKKSITYFFWNKKIRRYKKAKSEKID